jgi:hypothetical protein
VPMCSAGVQAARRPPLTTCSGGGSVGWRTDGAAPHPSGGSPVAVTTRAETTLGRLSDRETSRYPHTALCHGAHERPPCSRACQGQGRGSPRGPCATRAAAHSAGADVHSRGQARGVGPRGAWAFATPCHRLCRAPSSGSSPACPVRRQAHPLRAVLTREQPRHLERRLACEPLVTCPGPLRREPRPRLALPRWWLPARQILLAGGSGAEQPDRRCGTGPRERRRPDRRAGRAGALARRCCGTRAETAVGDDRLSPGAAREVRDVIAPHPTPARAAPRHRAQPGPRVGIVRRGRVAPGPFHVTAAGVGVANPGPIHGEARLHGGIGTPCGAPGALGGAWAGQGSTAQPGAA